MKIRPIFAAVNTNSIKETQNKNKYLTFNSLDSFEKQNTYNAVSFMGVDGKGKVKQRGMLFHITSLPATRSYCGQFLDPETDKFIDFLQKSKQTHWILNPLFALHSDLCPYNASGRFSKNIYIINLNELTKEKYRKLLKLSELPDDVTSPVFTLDMLKKQKDSRFEKAFSRFKKLSENHPLKAEYNLFKKENNNLWLETYAGYDTLTSVFKTDNWKKWPKDYQILLEVSKISNMPLTSLLNKTLSKNFPSKKVSSIMENIELYKFEQFLYDKQFQEFKQKLDSKNIRLILDLAIGVNPNGVDVWANKNLFLLNKDFEPIKVSGAPPESAYPYTQVWGHALYNYDSPDFWDYQENSLRKMLREGDLRLDHFVGYINRAEIPQEIITSDGRVLKGKQIFLPVEKGGLGEGFFEPSWIIRVDKKKNKNNENMFDLFKRVAQEEGLKPEDCYILEDFGPLAETEAYKEFRSKYAKNFISQRVPIGIGIGEDIDKIHVNNSSNPRKVNNQYSIALLTGNHDLPPIKQYIDLLLDNKPIIFKNGKNSPAIFKDFCKEQLKLTDEDLKDRNLVAREFMKWCYTRNVKQVQTTLQDALGLYFRPNIPGFWNGMEDKYLMKTSPEALLPFWSRVFPKNFLNRTDKSGINPGYKDLAEDYINLMNELFSNEK